MLVLLAAALSAIWIEWLTGFFAVLGAAGPVAKLDTGAALAIPFSLVLLLLAYSSLSGIRSEPKPKLRSLMRISLFLIVAGPLAVLGLYKVVPPMLEARGYMRCADNSSSLFPSLFFAREPAACPESMLAGAT